MSGYASTNRSIEGHVRTESGHRLPLNLTFRYSLADPYAVHVRFLLVGGQETVDWVFARQLLERGVISPTGEGDVRVWPMSTDASGGITGLLVRSPSGQATIELPTIPLVLFLNATHELCLPGNEAEHVDLDAELAALLEA